MGCESVGVGCESTRVGRGQVGVGGLRLVGVA